MVGWILKSLYEAIAYPFFSLGWYLLVYIPLAIIGFFNFVFQQLGINIIVRVIFGRDEFSFEKLPTVFWVFLITSVAIGFIFMIIRFVKFLTLRHGNSSMEISQMTKGIIVSLSFSFLFPILIFALLAILQAFMMILNQYIHDGKSIVYLLVRSSTDKISDSQVSKIAENYQVLSADEFNKLGNGEGTMMLISLCVGAIVVCYTLGISFVSWFISAAQLFMNFITMPAWATNAILDDGRNLKKWLLNFVGQVSVIVIYQTSFNLFLMWVSATFTTVESLDLSMAKVNQFIYKFFIKLAFMAGGGLAISTFTQQLASNFKQDAVVASQQRLASSTLKVAGASLGAAYYGLSKIGGNKLTSNFRDKNNLSKIKNLNPITNRLLETTNEPKSKSKWYKNLFSSLNGNTLFGVATTAIGIVGMRKISKKKKTQFLPEKSTNDSTNKWGWRNLIQKPLNIFRKKPNSNSNKNAEETQKDQIKDKLNSTIETENNSNISQISEIPTLPNLKENHTEENLKLSESSSEPSSENLNAKKSTESQNTEIEDKPIKTRGRKKSIKTDAINTEKSQEPLSKSRKTKKTTKLNTTETDALKENSPKKARGRKKIEKDEQTKEEPTKKRKTKKTKNLEEDGKPND